jgi:hypothetical protein
VTKILNIRVPQRFSKRAANAASVECGYVQTNSKKENLMNTYTDAMNPKQEAHQASRTSLFSHPAILAIIVTLVITVAIGVFIANRSAVAAEDARAVPYSNALEMQYARPWLEAHNRPVSAYSNALELQYAQPWMEAQNKPVVAYSNALELQYAQPWIEAQNKTVVAYSNALELRYAQPWLDARNKPVVAYSNALELQYAQPWLDQAELLIAVTGNAKELNCSNSIEMLYACKFGFGLP